MEIFDQITRTKVILPRRRPDLLSRQRLFDLFYNLIDYKFSFIIAPAGYGKTSLLIDAAYHVQLPVCWYTLDPLDKDTRRFIAHFIAAIAHIFPEFGRQSAASLNSSLDNSSDVNHLVTIIVNEIYEHIQEHFIFVLDDYHLTGKSETINYFINQFLNHVDENCHLIISSRSLLSLPDLGLLVARSQVAGLGLDKLAFQPEELQALDIFI